MILLQCHIGSELWCKLKRLKLKTDPKKVCISSLKPIKSQISLLETKVLHLILQGKQQKHIMPLLATNAQYWNMFNKLGQ